VTWKTDRQSEKCTKITSSLHIQRTHTIVTVRKHSTSIAAVAKNIVSIKFQALMTFSYKMPPNEGQLQSISTWTTIMHMPWSKYRYNLPHNAESLLRSFSDPIKAHACPTSYLHQHKHVIGSVGVEGLSVTNSDRETCFSKRNFFEFQK